MKDYPLASLLAVRNFREENAMQAVRRAESELRRLENLIRQCEEELAAYQIWRLKETEQRYAAIMGKPQTPAALDAFKAGLARLQEDETAREEALARSRQEKQQCAETLNRAHEAARQARKDTARILAHKDIWLEHAKREMERLADLELEEFRPALLQAASEDD